MEPTYVPFHLGTPRVNYMNITIEWQKLNYNKFSTKTTFSLSFILWLKLSKWHRLISTVYVKSWWPPPQRKLPMSNTRILGSRHRADCLECSRSDSGQIRPSAPLVSPLFLNPPPLYFWSWPNPMSIRFFYVNRYFMTIFHRLQTFNNRTLSPYSATIIIIRTLLVRNLWQLLFIYLSISVVFFLIVSRHISRLHSLLDLAPHCTVIYRHTTPVSTTTVDRVNGKWTQ